MESSRVLEQCRGKKIQYLTCLGTTSYSPSDDLEMGKSPYTFSNYYIKMVFVTSLLLLSVFDILSLCGTASFKICYSVTEAVLVV